MQIIEIVPNYSEGRDKEKMERIISPFKKQGTITKGDISLKNDNVFGMLMYCFIIYICSRFF